MHGLRLMVYDRTCRGGRMLPGLSRAWQAGGWLYRHLDRLDGVCGAATWVEALTWLASFGQDRPVREIQYWGHGKWGQVLVGDDPLDATCIEPLHPIHPLLCRVRDRLGSFGGEPALWWLRACETFGARAGQAFARAWADFLGCRVAGHTFVVGFHQSGLHTLMPGVEPRWPPEEGLRRGTADDPQEALPSRPWAPNTITCLHGQIPGGY